jgi:hypothetical protein
MISLNTPSLPANWIKQVVTASATPAAVTDPSLVTLSPPSSLVSISPPVLVSQEGEVFLHVTQMPATLNAPEVTYGPQGLIHVKAGQMQVWEQASDNAIGQVMGRNTTGVSAQSRLAGLGAALLEHVSSNASNYRQSVVNVGAPESAQKIQATAANSLLEFQSAPSARVELNIQTKSGASVRLAIVDQSESSVTGTGISVEVIVDGELSPAEKAALKSLANGFEKAVQGLAGDATQTDLEGLSKFDSNVISKLELKATIYGRDALGMRYEKLAASFKADVNTRAIQLKRPDGEVKMTTDLRQPAQWGSSEQKAYAVGQYLKHMDQAAQRGHASRDLVDMFKSTFMAMNASYGSQEAGLKVNDANATGPVNLNGDAATWSEEDKSLLTGLADFDATLSATPRASNPRKTMEQDTFQYSINQSTTISGSSQSNRAITQTQTAQLEAAYHQSLFSSGPPLLDDKSASQNYYFHQIEDSSSTAVHLAYEKNAPTSATLAQSSSQSQHVQKYEYAKLTDDRVTPPEVHLKQTDLMPLLKQLKDQQAARKMTDEEKQQVLKTWNAMVFQGL